MKCANNSNKVKSRTIMDTQALLGFCRYKRHSANSTKYITDDYSARGAYN